jgi:hypothetical protein
MLDKPSIGTLPFLVEDIPFTIKTIVFFSIPQHNADRRFTDSITGQSGLEKP